MRVGGPGESFDLGANGPGGAGSVVPGGGSSGFSSRTLVWGDPNGALFNDSSGPTWDSTQNRLGIGTSTPSGPFEVYSGTTQVMTLTTLNRVGILTTAPTRPLDISSTLGMCISTGVQNGYYVRNAITGIGFQSTVLMGVRISGSSMINVTTNGMMVHGSGGAAGPNGALEVATTKNSNVLMVSGTTAGNQPAFCIESTDTTSKIAFWSTAGTTRLAAITTQSTATQTTADIRNLQVAVNDLINVFKTFGQTA